LLNVLKSKGEQVLDLESLAMHKGSVFGGLSMPAQPTTEQFQNDIFEQVRIFDLNRRIWVEDESIAIGKIFLPLDLWRRMGVSPLVEVEVPREIRIRRLVNEYKQVPVTEFIEAMKGIQKKMGGQHFKAAQVFLEGGDLAAAIDLILNYYDKAYANGLQRKRDRIKLRVEWDGSSPERFAEYLTELRGVEK
jgi:tRNA 2-selenouridine synthase